MPKLKHYYHYKPNESGYISFICKNYVTMVVREWEDKESMNGLRQVKILIYPNEWEQLKVITNIEEVRSIHASWEESKK